MANYFNDYFISVGRDLTQSIPDLNDSFWQLMGEHFASVDVCDSMYFS